MSFHTALHTHYPQAIPQEQYLARTHSALEQHGFHQQNAIACVSVCRDEITRPLVDAIHATWGESFNLSSLAGLVFCGKTAFLAAQHHAPQEGGRERYVFFGLAHIGLGPEGQIGMVQRPGRTEPGNACGALVAFQKELERAVMQTVLDEDDLELSLVRRRLSRKIGVLEKPGLVDLVRVTYEAIVEDLGRMIDLTINTAHSDYALLTGIQIHGWDRAQYIWPGTLRACVSGHLLSLSID